MRTFDGAPKGYWWIVGALVALASAAMLLHESGSWMLDLAPLWGASVNIRAFSCDAHSLGLVFGYAVTQINGRKFARLVGDGLFWLIFFIAQVGNVLLFYGCLTVLDAPFAIVAVQFVGAASGAWFFVAASQVACMVGPALFMGTIVAVVSLTTLIVQGLFSMLEATSPLLVSELLHLGLVVAAGLCLVKAMAPGSCFPESYRRSFAPIRTREDGGGGTTEEKGGSASSDRRPDDLAPSRRRAPLCVRLFVIVGSYGMVFGFLHVIPLALPLGVVARVASFLVGAAVALALFVATLRRGRARGRVAHLEPLLPLRVPRGLCGGTASVRSPTAASFCRLSSCRPAPSTTSMRLLAMACSVISRAINAAPSQVFGRAFLIRSVGFLLGNLVGMEVHENLVLDTAAFSVIGTAVFVLLVLVTFNMNSEKYAKTVWGLLPHEDPRGRYERTRDERCSALADQFGLTERETEVLRLLARNKRPREISDVLVVSVATVRSHVHAIYTKTGVHSAAELAKLVECPQDKS